MDAYVQTGSDGLLDKNAYAYCEGDPVNYSDPTGEGIQGLDFHDFSTITGPNYGLDFGSSTSSTLSDISLSEALGYTTTMVDAGITLGLETGKYVYRTAERPKNIGVGAYKKYVDSALSKITKVEEINSTISEKLAYAQVVLETCEGINANVSNGASIGKIAWDVAVDVPILLTNTWIAAETGAAVGSLCEPGVGTIVGLGTGIVVGLGLDFMGQYVRNDLKSVY